MALSPLLGSAFKLIPVSSRSFFPQGNWDASHWVHFSLTSSQEGGQMLAQMNTSWTDVFIVLGRKPTFFNGKFFSFLDQRIFFFAVTSWNTLLIEHKSWAIHTELLMQRFLMTKIRPSSLIDVTETTNIKKACLSLSSQGQHMNKRSNIVCVQRWILDLTLHGSALYLCSSSYLFAPLLFCDTGILILI